MPSAISSGLVAGKIPTRRRLGFLECQSPLVVGLPSSITVDQTSSFFFAFSEDIADPRRFRF